MKAIVNTGKNQCEFKDWGLPIPNRGEVLIRTACCGICATDLKMIAGWQRTPFPAIPGHEWSGVVERVGEGVDVAMVGRHVVAENVLADGGEVGFEHPGGYGEFFVSEAVKLYPIPDDFPLHLAVLAEPLAVTVRAMNRLKLGNKNGLSSALIFGDGPIGLLMVLQLKRAGVKRVMLVGGRPKRLALAKSLGAEVVLNYHQAGTDLAGAVISEWKDLFPIIIEASGSGKGIQAALDLAKVEAKILVVGDYAEQTASFPWNQVLLREVELIGSNASAGGWAQAAQLLLEWRPLLEEFVTQRFPASRFDEGLALVREYPETIKVVLDWRES